MASKLKSVVIDIVLPTLLFLALAMEAGKAMGKLLETSLQESLKSNCPESLLSTPYRLPYTGIPAVDTTLCSLVSFFQAGLNSPGGAEFLNYFLITSLWLFIFPYVESYRQGQGSWNVLVAFPVITTQLSQLIPAGVMIPLFWPFLIIPGNTRFTWSTSNKTKSPMITQAHAESLIFGSIAGLAIPTAAMLIMKDIYVTAIWQFCPLWSYLAQQLHLLVRPPSATQPKSGYHTIKWFYLITFMLSSSLHLSTMLQKMKNLDPAGANENEGPLQFLLPVFNESVIQALSVGDQIKNFLRVDWLASVGSCILGSLWFASNSAEFFGLLAWYTFAIPASGLSAAFVGTLIWREYKLNETTLALTKDGDQEKKTT